MASFCTIDDLKQKRSAAVLAQLADDVSASPDINAANTQAVLNEAITQASNKVRSYVIGRLDLADAQVLADLKRWSVDITLYELYLRRNNFGPANPFEVARREAIDEMKAVREGKQSSGTEAAPSLDGWSSAQDASPVYAPAAVGGAGSDSALLEEF